MLTSDQHGCLFPYQGQRVDSATFYQQFVENIPTSKTRAALHHEWMKYNKLLRQELGAPFEQWIDGSFVTTKRNPNDIDLVSFIPAHLYEKHEAILDKFWSDTWEAEGIDAYLVNIYPTADIRFTTTQADRQQWTRRYTSTKPDLNFVSRPKGFLIIQIL